MKILLKGVEFIIALTLLVLFLFADIFGTFLWFIARSVKHPRGIVKDAKRIWQEWSDFFFFDVSDKPYDKKVARMKQHLSYPGH